MTGPVGGSVPRVAAEVKHGRDEMFRIGSPFYGGEYQVRCVCGWRSPWEYHHYKAEWDLNDHVKSVAVSGDEK